MNLNNLFSVHCGNQVLIIMSEKSESFTTLVYGASLKPFRYSHRAINILNNQGFPVIALGLKEGVIHGQKVLTGHPEIDNIHTITMYLNAQNQMEHYDYILSLKPKRIIFNPGAENPELSKLARAKGIYTENACSLVLLSIGEFEKMGELA